MFKGDKFSVQMYLNVNTHESSFSLRSIQKIKKKGLHSELLITSTTICTSYRYIFKYIQYIITFKLSKCKLTTKNNYACMYTHVRVIFVKNMEGGLDVNSLFFY